MSSLCGNDPFCQGLPGSIPQNSDHGEALWNFFLGYDSFRKGTAPLRDTVHAIFKDINCFNFFSIFLQYTLSALNTNEEWS